ncbi:hypothetical protein RIF23_06130 [Lipingzhangella sp. LS1_29]|uniref:Integral membrane protein n=1 Tax=Lipingzhangella rawalii TaxID=2055835 RepID=A0ABU2H3J2_9ACTN|nr:hypothetical protein [Lipingzhangella rawalii]MDS1269871.1 hypothetical protein [Lipingzhangella rawalii]
MVDWLSITIVVVSVAVAVWTLIATVRDQPMLVPHLAGLALLELLLLVQLGVSITLMLGGQTPEQNAVFIGYLASVVLIPPAAAVWGLTERSRWGPAVIAFSGVVLIALVLRLDQIWTAGIG